MIAKGYCEPFLGENVDIGVPHLTLDRLFFHTGELLEVNDDCLILRKKDGIKQIQLSEVVEISFSKRGNR